MTKRNGCDECWRLVSDGGWSLVGACASVGIEHGKSTDEMLAEWLAVQHGRHATASAQ